MTRPRRSLKKRRSEDNIDRRTKSITLEPVPGHRFPLIVIQLCVLIYMRTPCGLRKVVTIQGHHWLQAYTSCRHQSFHGCDSQECLWKTIWFCGVYNTPWQETIAVSSDRQGILHIITHVLGNAHSRQVHAGIKMLEYFNREEALLTANMSINVSSDIIESTFGIYKSKKSPNKLYGVTSFVLTIPLYPKVSNESVTKTINFKECIVNVKLKDISTWSTEHLSKNWVTERTKTLRKVS